MRSKLVRTLVVVALAASTLTLTSPASAATKCYNTSSKGNLIESGLFRTDLGRVIAKSYWCKSTSTGKFTRWDARGDTWSGGGWHFEKWFQNEPKAFDGATYKRSYHWGQFCGVGLEVLGAGWANCDDSDRGLKVWSTSGGDKNRYRAIGYS